MYHSLHGRNLSKAFLTLSQSNPLTQTYIPGDKLFKQAAPTAHKKLVLVTLLLDFVPGWISNFAQIQSHAQISIMFENGHMQSQPRSIHVGQDLDAGLSEFNGLDYGTGHQAAMLTKTLPNETLMREIAQFSTCFRRD